MLRALTNVLARPRAILLGITGRPAHPSARRLMGAVLTEADMPDIPLLLVDGYALPVTVRLYGEHVTWQEGVEPPPLITHRHGG